MTRRTAWVGVLALTVLVAAGLAVLVTRESNAPGPVSGGTPAAPRSTAIDATGFLDTYADDDGRVVRRDQGGDTVSEGQAYGMLIALVADDEARFGQIWQWTRSNLMREDGLLSWRWDDGSVVDPASASDAEVDVLRALLLAAEAFDEPAYADDATTLGDAVLEQQTIRSGEDLVLVAGEWATGTPAWFNPSYVAPATTQLLFEETGDPRWQQLERGSRAAVESLTADAPLPPNWAGIDDGGRVYPQPSPDGTQVEYGYDAARTLVRHAESCVASDRRLAADATTVVRDNAANAGRPIVAVYDLGGAPLTEATSPLAAVAQAAGLAASGDSAAAAEALAQAEEDQRAAPTYYGDAWAVLGPALLTDPALGGCPPLADLR